MTPTRTCVGCRTRRPQPVLRRFVRREDRWTVDGAVRSTGRGAYLCSPDCARAVVKNKRFPGLGAVAITHFEHQDAPMYN